jgi:flagellar biosynthesis anti-sigma factor FlgM
MKIEGNRPNLEPSAASKVEGERVTSRKGKDASGKVGSDAVTVSADVHLAQKAIDTASQPLDVRPDVVARGKALLASGTLGADANALADTIIQRLIDGQG